MQKSKNELIKFIKETVQKSGAKKLILGLSGGMDSAATAYLSVLALGRENVIAVLMHYKDFDKEGAELADLMVKNLGIKSYNVDIAPGVDAYFKNFPDADDIRRGNKMARERMSVLYDLSKKEEALVIGSGNKTEISLGYCTLHGDTACALNPLARLYKTDILKLAEELGVPESVIKRKPTAGLWKGQTDEEELGYSYKEMDRLLSLMLDSKKTYDELKKEGFSEKFIRDIRERITMSDFKRRPTSIPEA
ncbi:MAG: NAD+ synthase [Candidatus Omnitrophica bacterium]|nr:NAD+ synthase [Candidatus Omnitrophota bacterium]